MPTHADERYLQITAQLIRALRGRRSQSQLSRLLGYRSNAVHTWEAEVAVPPATRVFELAQRAGVDLRVGLQRFFRDVPRALRATPLTTPEGVRALVRALKGRSRVGALSDASGLSRFALSRWLSGKAQPSLPDLLCFVDHASLRLLDFVAVLVDPARLPALAEPWAHLQAARALGYRRPESHAVLRALETTAYRRAPGVATIARLTQLTEEVVAEDLASLVDSDQVTWDGTRHTPTAVEAVDFRRDPERAQQVKAYWAELAAQRTQTPRPGLFAYNVFAVSRADLERITELQRAYLREMQTIIADSEPSEVVALANMQMFALED